VDSIERGLGGVEGYLGFGLGVVGFGYHAREVFESQIDVHGTRGTVEAGKL